MKTDIEHYRRQFYQEMREILETVSKDLLQAESDPDNKELLNSIFRGIHTIKGSAGTLDLNEISDFTHHLEGMLVALREGNISLDPGIVDIVLEGADELTAIIGRLEKGEPVIVNNDLVERFRSSYQDVEKESAGKAGTSQGISAGNGAVYAGLAEVPDEIRPHLQQYAEEGLHIFRVAVNYPSEVFENGFDPMVFLRNLKEASTFYHAEKRKGQFPDFDEYEPLKLYLNPVVYAATGLSEEEVIDLCFDSELVRVSALDCGKIGKTNIAYMPDKADMHEFLVGAGEMIESIESAVMDYEKTDAVESLNRIFRIVHTIKGDVAYIGLTELKEFTHVLESVLECLRKGTIRRTPAVVDMLLKSLDFLKVSIDRLREGKDVIIIPELSHQIKNCLEGKDEETDPIIALPENGLKKALFEQIGQYRNLLITSLSHIPPDGERAKMIRRSLNSLSRTMSSLGIKTIDSLLSRANDFIDKKEYDHLNETIEELVAFIDGLMGKSKKIGKILVEGGKLTEEELDRTLARQKPIGKLLVEEGKVSESDLVRALKKQELMNVGQQLKSEGGAAEPEVKTLRIDERKVVQFSDIVGELMIARNTYEYLINQLGGANGNLPSIIKSLRDNLHLFSRLSNDMHHGVMSLRMIPIRGIFQKFSRVIRDISRKQQKDIRLLTEGEEIEIDKKVADILSDPLIHIIRNSCDHGIGTRAERRQSGKPDEGTLILRAAQEGSSLMITIIDDGKGIDKEKLREKASAMGVGNVNGDEDLLDLIFMPGLSTKNMASDISGRGVGMDVVKTSMNSLGGTVKVASEWGKGTEIILTIPMTMGINEVLLVESGMNHYALPIDSVVETIKIDEVFLHTNHGNRFFHCRGEVIPADRLETILKIKGNGNTSDKKPAATQTNRELYIVIIKNRSRKRGIIVDRLHRNMEIAVKPIPGSLAGIDVISGVSIMGDGKVLLMLNPERLV